MAAMYIPNMSQCKDLTTTLGTVKGKALPSVDGTRYANDRKRHGGQQTEADLAAKDVDPALRCHCCLPPRLRHLDLLPLSGSLPKTPTHAHSDDPSK